MGVNSDQLSYSDNWLIGHLVQSLLVKLRLQNNKLREDEGFMAGQTLKQTLDKPPKRLIQRN